MQWGSTKTAIAAALLAIIACIFSGLAAEAAIGLAIFVSLFRLHRSINVDQMNAMGD